MNEEARDIVCDTGPIIHLDELGCLDLLADFKEILLTVSVVEEIEKHRPVALRVKLPFRILRAHHPADERLTTVHGLKPGQYRKQFNVPKGQPLAATEYVTKRRQMALDRGLGENLAVARAARKARQTGE